LARDLLETVAIAAEVLTGPSTCAHPLRRKIEKDVGHPEAIRTVRGVGYMFAAHD
jgi:hypothetical protein